MYDATQIIYTYIRLYQLRYVAGPHGLHPVPTSLLVASRGRRGTQHQKLRMTAPDADITSAATHGGHILLPPLETMVLPPRCFPDKQRFMRAHPTTPSDLKGALLNPYFNKNIKGKRGLFSCALHHLPTTARYDY